MRGLNRRGAGHRAEGNERHAVPAAAAAAVAGTDRRTRRRVLAGAAGVLGVAAAEVVGKAAPARADNGNAVLQGTDNGTPTARTAVLTANSNEVGILADPGTSGQGSLGVYGIGQTAGVRGDGGGNGDGVDGYGSGVGSGVFGQGGNNNGVGVFGQAPSGSGAGVVGQCDSSVGVQGTAAFSTGTGVLATNSGGGTALQVEGTASFTNSGVLTVRAGHSSVTHSSFVLTTASLVLATLQQHVAGVYVLAAVPNTTSNTFTVYLSKTVTAPVKVAWFVIN